LTRPPEPKPVRANQTGTLATLPRSEYPRPQFIREAWLCLNGVWQFEIDRTDDGLERGLPERELTGEIVVPFCPESELSGIGERDFMEAVWYRRTVPIPAGWGGQRLLLHFQAVDQDATVWVDGVEVVRHRGGWTPFTADLGVISEAAELTIVVRARDPKTGSQARGKQSDRLENYGCLYTRTTGIWQTVWLEPVAESYLLRPRITPDLSESAFQVEVGIRGPRRGLSLRARLSDDTGEVAMTESRVEPDFSVRVLLPVAAERRRLWSPEDPFLYDLELELVDHEGRVVDSARSYAGLRSVSIDGRAVLLNGEPLFQRLVLDQGYYPDGVLTAPTEQTLIRDIELSLAAGFNGARLHQKVFEERFLYHCDRLGYLVWGEFGDWGARSGEDAAGELAPTPSFITQWLEALERDYSHPSIVGWCPLNETAQPLEDRITTLDDVTRGMYLAAKAIDQTRPVLDASGWAHRVAETDIYDAHCYEQVPDRFATTMAGLADSEPYTDLDIEMVLRTTDYDTLLAGLRAQAEFAHLFADEEPSQDEVLGVLAAQWPRLPWSIPYRGQPYFVSEFGGIGWNPDATKGEESWGYGDRPATLEDFYRRFEGLTSVLLDNPEMFGYCYTQLTDVYQEQNGIYRFDRTPKFDTDRIRAAQTRPAAIEKQ
jgi:beta-galactosidase/beta-glucuronidase